MLPVLRVPEGTVHSVQFDQTVEESEKHFQNELQLFTPWYFVDASCKKLHQLNVGCLDLFNQISTARHQYKQI